MISFYNMNDDYNNDIIDFSINYPNFRQVLNHDSTPRYTPRRLDLQETSTPSNTPTSTSFQNTSNTFYNRLIGAINPLLGEKYSNSKRLQKGFSDCSGFVNKVYKQLGVDLKGAGSGQLWQMGTAVSLDLLKPGDLAFLTTTSNRNVAGYVRRAGKDTSHVAIVLERLGTKIKVAESTGSQGTVTQWWEVGDPSKKERGVINYSKGSGRRDMIFGFRRLLQ